MIYFGIANGLFLLRGVLGRMNARMFYWPVLIGLFLFSAFRWQVGCDWSGYYYQYALAPALTADQLVQLGEPIWWLTLRRLSEANAFYPLIHVIASAVFFAGAHMLARRQPDRLAFLILLFPVLIINITLSGDRQAAAIGLMCIAFVAFEDRKPLHFVFWTLLAASFHASAMVFLLMAPIATGRYTRLRLAAAALLAVPGLYLLWQSSSAQTSVDRYVGTDTDAAGAIFRVGVLALSGLYFLLFLRRQWAKQCPEDYPIMSIAAIGMILLAALVPLSTVIADRFGYYLVPIQALAFARIPYLSLRRDTRLEAVAPYVGLSLLLGVWIYSSKLFGPCYVPYQTWMFGVPSGPILK